MTSMDTEVKAEQIISEARERQEADEIRPPKQKIGDSMVSEYRLRRRKQFQDWIGGGTCTIHVWIKYAEWEDSQNDYAHAQSVWERALGSFDRNYMIWFKYAEFEMKNKSFKHARNVWDRAVEILPLVDLLWYKYIHMEEMLGNIAEARQVYERWMVWSPDHQAWLSFIKFELSHNEIELARSIYERFVLCHPKVPAYILYAKFEMEEGETERARNVYERATKKFADDEKLFVAYAEFEEGCKEVERARSLYKSALDRIPIGRTEDLYKKYVSFEKQYGDKEVVEDAIVGKRRFQYEVEVRKNPLNYDSWFDYLRLEESLGNKDRIREIYDRAIANVPPAEEKRYWQRYIYLWINYALFEETETEDVERTRLVYRECLKLIPHTKVSFAKIWLLAAKFEIRQLNLTGGRRILDNAIGKAPKDKIFKKYIEMELHLGNISRCRKLYQRYLEWSPENCYTWTNFAELERSLAETERARAIFELAISQPALDMPELLWKAYIDFEISQGEVERTRALYERLLDRTKHYKVWVSFAMFEAEQQDDVTDSIRRARAVFDRATTYYKDCTPDLKEERASLLEDWLSMETSFGKLGDVDLVQTKLKKRKAFTREDGSTEYEEYLDCVFPEESQTNNLKIIEAACTWKKQKLAAAAS
ncbi:PREDICTED: crooked neck-like protein 1 [Camelina sativa]|uniref:Crooked neck-like protein 1 n=1 Tax=Camelina sativa TaxID=90675 RepID=A0ABM0X4H4_CAMSA|nr:PREDICTED: crooked neck-like protein 1 [Camelina sativa]